ncbi:hypothetical protein Tco_1553405 [Tanacetum coccineum]
MEYEMKLFVGFDTMTLKPHFRKKIMELEDEKRATQKERDRLQAEICLWMKNVPLLLLMKIDEDGRITEFSEKPKGEKLQEIKHGWVNRDARYESWEKDIEIKERVNCINRPCGLPDPTFLFPVVFLSGPCGFDQLLVWSLD